MTKGANPPREVSKSDATSEITNVSASSDWLTSLLDELRRRGITFVMAGNRLKVRPWKLLTAEEAATIQANRAALKAIITAEEANPTPNVEPPSPPTPTCEFCYQPLPACSAMRETRPEVFDALHASSAEVIEKRRQYNTRVMKRMMHV